MIHADLLYYNTVAIEEQFMDTTLPNMEMSERSASVGDSIHCINKGIYTYEVMMLTILMKMFLTFLDRFYWIHLHLLQTCFERKESFQILINHALSHDEYELQFTYLYKNT
jgi:hypothetical protein